MNRPGPLRLIISLSLVGVAVLAVMGAACSPSVPLDDPSMDGGTAGGTSTGGATGAAGAGQRGASGAGGAVAPPVHPKVYRLTQTRSLASPLPDPTGIASDGAGLWILNGGQNSASNTLVHFNPDALTTDKTFQFQGLIGMLGSGAYGITWDGAAVWISVSGNTNQLVKVDPTTGQISRTMSSPTDLGPSDLDYDGSHLWLSSGTGTAFEIDPTTGGIEKHFAIGVLGAGRDNGVAVRAGEVWVGDLFGGVTNMFGGMEVFDPVSGALTATASHGDGSPFSQDEMGSMCFVGGELVIASHYGITFYRADLAP
jgi:hypothetical protein